MRHVGAIATRELRSLFSTPVAFGLLATYLFFAGYLFFLNLGVFLQQMQQIQAYGRLDLLEQFSLNDMIIVPALGTYSVVFFILIPLLTMRVFSEERSHATIELLLTSPLSIWEIVLGKYLAVLAMVALLVALTAFFPLLLFVYGNPEVLQTVSGLLALFLYGAALAALGCFVSSLTKSQSVAAVISIILGLFLFIIGQAAEYTGTGWVQETLRYLSLQTHFDKGLKGLLQSQDLVYYGVFVVLCLALLRTSLESLRWR